jgi:hypothetical protein
MQRGDAESVMHFKEGRKWYQIQGPFCQPLHMPPAASSFSIAVALLKGPPSHETLEAQQMYTPCT